MRRQFDEQLEELAREMISMGAMIESAIDKACDALMRHDVALAKSVMEADHLVDQKERTIESMCLRLLLMQQPIARDLRKVSSALKMITDMERIGDQAGRHLRNRDHDGRHGGLGQSPPDARYGT